MPHEERHRQLRRRAIAAVGVSAPLLLIVLALLHAIWHDRFTLDWQTVTLLITGAVLLLVPMKEILAKVLKLKVGGFELELRKDTEDLTQKVIKAEAEAEATTGEPAKVPSGLVEAAPSPSHETTEDRRTIQWPSRDKYGRRKLGDLGELNQLHYEVDQLSGVSPTAGLIRLASALEQQIIAIATTLQPARKTPVRSVPIAVQTLMSHEQIPSSLAEALLSFWKLRNKIVHQSGPVDDSVIRTAITDGFRLLIILKELHPTAAPNTPDALDPE